MEFYKLRMPDYRSYREETRRNGWGGHEIGMPGVDCSVCGDTRGMPGRVLPYRLPDALERELRERDLHPIPEDEHKALRARVEAALHEDHPDMPPMPPGADFPPLDWNFPAAPEGDIHWSSQSFAVSARLADALRAMQATGFDLIPIDNVRIGVPPPDDDDDDNDDDDGDEPPRGDMAGTAGPELFYLSIAAEGRLNSRMKRMPACSGCGYADVDRGYRWERWEDAIHDGHDIFHFPTTTYIVVTGRIAALLRELGTENVQLTRLRPGVDAFEPFYKSVASGIGRIIPWFAWWDLKRDGLS